ncbi:MAG TPA: CPXCG motif-containing cysteine-rich protein [Bacteroidota bacterium]
MTGAEIGVYRCACCGEDNETIVDPSGGFNQKYVEDCSVCCRSNVLRITVDPETGSVFVESEPES